MNFTILTLYKQFKVMKWKRMIWTRYVARMHLTTFLPGNLTVTIHLVDQGVDGLISEMVLVKWIYLAQRRDHDYALFSSVIDFQISYKMSNFWLAEQLRIIIFMALVMLKTLATDKRIHWSIDS
jgi:hypothetical protein